MSEPENHTLHLLREIREEIQGVEGAIKNLDRKVDRGFSDVKLSMDGLTQSLAGEIATRGYAVGGIERRLTDIEKRLSDLEHSDSDT
jgi:hypothetical protein